MAEIYEQQGYVCWTLLRLFRKPGRKMHGTYGLQTKLVEALLKVSVGIVPQAEYRKRYAKGLRVKNPDVVGFHFGLNRWLFAEVKRENDRLNLGQAEGLRLLRALIPPDRADVFLAELEVKQT